MKTNLIALVGALVLFLPLAGASPSYAQPSVDSLQPTPVSGTDYTALASAGLLGNAVGLVAGYYGGVSLSDSICVNGRGASLGCALLYDLGPIVGVTSGSMLFTGLAIGGMGSLVEVPGSTGLASLLSGLGTIVGIGWFAGNRWAGGAALLTLPPLLGIMGYFIGDDEVTPQRTSLLVVSEEGLDLGVPALSVTPTRGEWRATLPVLGGRF